MHGLLKQPVWLHLLFLWHSPLRTTCTTLLRRLQAEQTAGRKVLAAPARTEISHACGDFLPLMFYIYHSEQVSLRLF